GQVMLNNVVSPRLPISMDFLPVNDSTTVRIFVAVQGVVDSFSLTENGTTADIFGTPSAFSQTQTISGNFTGGGGGGTPAPLTITASNETQQYGGVSPNLNHVTYSGFVNGDDSSVLTGSLNCTTAATATSPTGSYPINCSGLSSTSYSISYVPGQLTVTAAPLSITANNAARQYGLANPAFAASVAGFVNGEAPAVLTGVLSCASSATPASPVSANPDAINCSGLSSTNY